jgi:hypothetical protein
MPNPEFLEDPVVQAVNLMKEKRLSAPELLSKR